MNIFPLHSTEQEWKTSRFLGTVKPVFVVADPKILSFRNLWKRGFFENLSENPQWKDDSMGTGYSK